MTQSFPRRAAVHRKSRAWLMKAPRAYLRLRAGQEDYEARPPILCNSFPKSGTHLLMQILATFPDVEWYRSFLASVPSVPFKERSERTHLRMIGRIVPGELVPGHLHYEPAYEEALRSINCAHYFIYRDLRDVAVSEAYYLTYMNRWHRLHRHFRKELRTMEERILTSITGVHDQDFPYDYPNIAQRFQRYIGWLNQPNVYAIRFEDLSGDSRQHFVQQMLDFYVGRNINASEVPKQLAERAVLAIQPSRSHTFRSGRAGSWREEFTEKHRDAMKQVAGDLLIQLGYAADYNW
ncbi:MAG: sulfotransferase domain-containing protein [Gemmatimonadota bacterium]|nr:MAG: sulfotransferase domain-containing protein [Gemmatimonadota bacterium]